MESKVSAFEIYRLQQEKNKHSKQTKIKKAGSKNFQKNKASKFSNATKHENADTNSQSNKKKKLKSKNYVSIKNVEQHNEIYENETKILKKIPKVNILKENKSGNLKKNKRKLLKCESDINGTDTGTLNNENGSDEDIPMLVKIPTKKPKIDERKTNIHKKKSNAELNAKKHKYDCVSDDDEENVTEGFKVFKWMLAPISPATFFQKYWEKETLYVARNKPFYYEHILTTNALDHMLRDHTLHYTRNVDVVSYNDGVKEVFNQEGRAIPAALWDYYSNGCSIRILNPQTYNSEIHLLIATLQEYFGSMVGTNVYLTPPGSQGFAPHYDDIEAFVIQLEGRKHWKLYKPRNEDVLARNSSPNLNREDIGSPFMEVTLNAGDILYFPRGTIHEGCTDADAHSLHITVSVYQHTAHVDLLEKILPNALQKAAAEDLEFRKGLPINYLKYLGLVNKDNQSDDRKILIKKLQNLVASLTKYIDVDHGADLMGKQFIHDCLPPVLSQDEIMLTCRGDGDFLSEGIVKNRAEFDLDTSVRLLRYHCIRAVSEENAIRIYYCTDNAKVYHGEEEQWIEIDTKLLPAIKYLQNNYPAYVRIEDLPIEGDAEKVQLISDMWERGLIKTSSPLSIVDSVIDSEDNNDEEEDNLSISDM